MPQSEVDTAKFQWPRWFDRALKAFLALVIGSTLGVLAESLALDAGWLQGAAWSKASFAQDSRIPSGWAKVQSVDPGGQLGQAGIVAGDLLKPDNPFYHMQIRFAGDRSGFTVDRNGQRSHVTITETPIEAGTTASDVQWILLLQDLNSLALVSFVLVLLFRRWREKAAMSLAFLLLAFSIPGGVLPHWAGNTAIAWIIIMLQIAGIALLLFALPFCHYLVKPRMTRGEAALVKVWAAVCVLIALLVGLGNALQFRLPVIGDPILLFPLAFTIQLAITIAILVRNYRSTDAVGRNRIKLVAVAFVLSTLGYSLGSTFAAIFGTKSALYLPVTWLASLLIISGPLLLVYTVLRHKLFDFGFAVNRALVYGIVSALILIGIGLSEWAAKKLVPSSWHEASAFYSAGIALGLFLLFHRIHHWVEHHVEHWFFHQWQTNEEQMRQFIEAASHYERQDSLMRDTAAEFRRFTGSQEVALFWKQQDEDYLRLHGELGASLMKVDADDPAVARARVKRGAVAVEETGSKLPANLILPVIDHGQVVGFLALGAKPNSVGYRPDEVELMAWAAQQAGLDLQSMQARSLEAKVSSLEAQVERLSSILAERPANA